MTRLEIAGIFLYLTFFSYAYKIYFVGFSAELMWPIGQAVKTPPFHGGNRGSSPLWVPKDYQS